MFSVWSERSRHTSYDYRARCSADTVEFSRRHLQLVWQARSSLAIFLPGAGGGCCLRHQRQERRRLSGRVDLLRKNALRSPHPAECHLSILLGREGNRPPARGAVLRHPVFLRLGKASALSRGVLCDGVSRRLVPVSGGSQARSKSRGGVCSGAALPVVSQS